MRPFCKALFLVLVVDCIYNVIAKHEFSFIKDAATAIPNNSGYDYIIVGGGTAGCALAATLSSSFNVLVLERGGSPYDNLNITRREGYESVVNDVGPNRPMQAFFSTEGTPNVRARVLGGGSSINAGIYTRASHNYILQAGLEEQLVNKSFEWVETVVSSLLPPERYQAMVRQSMLEAGVVPDNGASYEHLIGTKTTGTLFDTSGFRRPASDLFDYTNGDNIQVLLHATVHRVLFDDDKRAYGVEYTDSFAKQHLAILRDSQSEIVLTAGALGSPQLLLLSGVGPSKHLSEMSIPIVYDSPYVGKFMADNPEANIWVPSPAYIIRGSREQVVAITNFSIIIEGGSRTVSYGYMGVLLAEVTGPRSLGMLELNSVDPEDNPKVTFNYFKEPEDLESCIAGVHVMEEMVLSDAFKEYRFGNQPLPSGGTVTEPHKRDPAFANSIKPALARYCLENYVTAHHYHGGCLVGKVVDKSLKVLGVRGLRVVDGSTFDVSPGSNPQGTVMMMGRYMGIKMLNERASFSDM